MNLSPAEASLVDILRDKVGPTFTISITKIDVAVVVTMAIPGNGVSIGSGPSFEAAFYSMAGVEPPAESPGQDEATELKH